MKEKLFGLALVLIILGSFVVRLYRFDNPIADWHSWRQADTASVTRNFVKEGFDPLLPKFNIYNPSNEKNLPNPNRYFLVEAPIYNTIHYFAYISLGHFSLEEWGRLINIVVSSLTVLFLYLLVSIYSGKKVALLSAAFFAFIPFNVYFGRTLLPDPLSILFSLIGLYFVAVWTKKNNMIFSIPAGLFLASSFLIKPYSLVLLLPALFLIIYTWPFTFMKKWQFYLFGILAIAPLVLWRAHIGNYPEGIPASTWLFNGGDIRFSGAFFRWLIFDRMNRLIFATGGFVLFFIGIIRGYEKKEELFYYLWLLSIGIYFAVIAKGNVTHDYYQLPLVPIGAVFIAKGFDSLLSTGKDKIQKIINISVAISLVLIMLSFGWYETRGYFNINNPAIVDAGKAADRFLPKNAKVIAPYLSDSAFLYQTNRNGWTLGGVFIPQYIKEGAQYLVSVELDKYTNFWVDHCKVLDKTPRYVIVDLSKCSNISNPPQ